MKVSIFAVACFFGQWNWKQVLETFCCACFFAFVVFNCFFAQFRWKQSWDAYEMSCVLKRGRTLARRRFLRFWILSSLLFAFFALFYSFFTLFWEIGVLLSGGTKQHWPTTGKKRREKWLVRRILIVVSLSEFFCFWFCFLFFNYCFYFNQNRLRVDRDLVETVQTSSRQKHTRVVTEMYLMKKGWKKKEKGRKLILQAVYDESTTIKITKNVLENQCDCTFFASRVSFLRAESHFTKKNKMSTRKGPTTTVKEHIQYHAEKQSLLSKLVAMTTLFLLTGCFYYLLVLSVVALVYALMGYWWPYLVFGLVWINFFFFSSFFFWNHFFSFSFLFCWWCPWWRCVVWF